MSAIKFFLALLFLLIWVIILLFGVCQGKKTKAKRPKRPVKTFPKYTKNKKYLAKPNKKNKPIWIKSK